MLKGNDKSVEASTVVDLIESSFLFPFDETSSRNRWSECHSHESFDFSFFIISLKKILKKSNQSSLFLFLHFSFFQFRETSGYYTLQSPDSVTTTGICMHARDKKEGSKLDSAVPTQRTVLSLFLLWSHHCSSVVFVRGTWIKWCGGGVSVGWTEVNIWRDRGKKAKEKGGWHTVL